MVLTAPAAGESGGTRREALRSTAMVDNGYASIVVGVDGSEAGTAALAWALAEAARCGHALDAVVVAEHEDPGTHAEVEAAAAACPEVAVRYVHATGAPGPVLVRAADKAALLVVGSHGHGRLAAALLGSVSAYCIGHSACPVVVVPDPGPVTGVAEATEESGVDALATPGPLL